MPTVARNVKTHLFCICAAGTLLTANGSAHAATLPAGFTEAMITGPIDSGTAMKFAPDGKLFILEQAGTCQVYEGSGGSPWTQVASDFFEDTPLSVDDFFERGLLGIAFDPDYANNRFVYVYYTNTDTPRRNVIERYTANAAGSRALASSATTIMELDPLSAGNHNGGAIHFGPDGMLYAGVGENANALNSQSLDNRLGKLLRLNADPNDPIPGDNPMNFPGIVGTPEGDNRAIWAVGLRNPYTFTFKPGTDTMFINDVGGGSFEEINLGDEAANYGWPQTEGPFDRDAFPAYTHPIAYYHHVNDALSFPPLDGFTGNVITGGAFYITDNFIFPLDYAGDYFFADLGGGWINRYDPDEETVQNFASNAGAVDVKVGSDGALYYLARFTGRVFRVVPTDPACFADTVTTRTFQPPPDGIVDGADLAFLLGEWGDHSGGPGSPADVVTSATFQPPPDGVVDGADLAFLLGAWGECP